MQSFELQTFNSGKWKMDSVYDDRTLAIHEAKRADEGNRYAGIRVIEENFDEATNLTTTRTLFRAGVAKAENQNKPQAGAQTKSTGPRTGNGKGKERVRKGGANTTAKKSNFLVPVLMIVLVLLGGLAALFGLERLASLT